MARVAEPAPAPLRENARHSGDLLPVLPRGGRRLHRQPSKQQDPSEKIAALGEHGAHQPEQLPGMARQFGTPVAAARGPGNVATPLRRFGATVMPVAATGAALGGLGDLFSSKPALGAGPVTPAGLGRRMRKRQASDHDVFVDEEFRQESQEQPGVVPGSWNGRPTARTRRRAIEVSEDVLMAGDCFTDCDKENRPPPGPVAAAALFRSAGATHTPRALREISMPAVGAGVLREIPVPVASVDDHMMVDTDLDFVSEALAQRLEQRVLENAGEWYEFKVYEDQ